MPVKFLATLLDALFQLTCLPLNDAYPIIIDLLGNTQNIYSITQEGTQEDDGKVSILASLDMNQKLYIEKKGGCCLTYHCLSVETAEPALNDSGMLGEITDLFTKMNVSILCTSTFNKNFIFFGEQDYSEVVEWLNNDENYEFEIEERVTHGRI